MITRIDAGKCIGCARCVKICPIDAFRMVEGKAQVSYGEDCMTCYICELGCPAGAIFVHPFKAVPPEVIPGILDAKEGESV